MEKEMELSAAHRARLAKYDKFSAICAALVPTGVVLGNVAFDGFVGLAGLSWLMRSILAQFWGEPGLRQSFARLGRHPLILPCTIWYIAIVLSFLWNGPNLDKLGYNLVFVRHLIFITAAVDISQRLPIFKYLLYGLAGGTIVAGLNSLSAHLFGYDLIGNPLSHYINKRFEAPRIAHLVAYSAPFFWGWSLALFNNQSDAAAPLLSIERRAILIGLTLVAVILVLISDIRTYIFSMVAGLILVFIMSGRKVWLKNLLVLGGVAAVLVMFFTHMDRFQNSVSIYHRFYIWKISWLMGLDHPILGVSVSAYREIFSRYASVDLAASFNLPDPTAAFWAKGHHAHNLFLMVFSVTGLAGFGAFLCLLINAVRLALRPSELRWRIGLASWSASFLAIALVGANIYDGATAALFVFFVALIGSQDIHLRGTGIV